MQISVVIPTYKRVNDLSMCLNSIINQMKLPKEVLVIDNGNDAKTSDLINKRKNEFEEKGIALKYIKNKENSLTVAKNIGVQYSTGEIISFLDDDLTIDRKYYQEILEVYNKIPTAFGVEGYNECAKLDTRTKVRLLETVHKLFYLSSHDNYEFRVLPSLGVTYPHFVDKIYSCEWISGASTYKREILMEIKPDDNLKKYSWNEDQDLSYRVFKKYPNTLFITPFAKYTHKGSKEGRLPSKELTYMAEVYDLYLFYKNIDQNLKNKLIYLWSRIGRLTLSMIFSIFNLDSKFMETKYIIAALLSCVKHRREIKEGNITFFNKTLT